jgi:hypothetical protein
LAHKIRKTRDKAIRRINFLLSERCRRADCKNLTKRYEMHGYTRTSRNLLASIMLEDDDFFAKFITWANDTKKFKIRWPFGDNLHKALNQSLTDVTT